MMSLGHKQRGSSSTQFLVADGDNESQGRNAKENLPALGLNAPVFTSDNNSQAAVLSKLTIEKKKNHLVGFTFFSLTFTKLPSRLQSNIYIKRKMFQSMLFFSLGPSTR